MSSDPPPASSTRTAISPLDLAAPAAPVAAVAAPDANTVSSTTTAQGAQPAVSMDTASVSPTASSTTTAVAAAPIAPAAVELPQTTVSIAPKRTESKRKRKSKRKRHFFPKTLTAGISDEMRNVKSAEEFENNVEDTTVNNNAQNMRSIIPSLSDLSLAFSAASKSVSDLSVAAVSATKSAVDTVSKASRAASETAIAVGATLSDVSQKVADASKVAMDSAVVAKQRTTDAIKVATDTATAVSEKVSAASKTISDTTTAIMETASAAKQKITDASKTASETAAVVSQTVTPVVSAVSSGVAAAANTVSDVAVNISASTSDLNLSSGSPHNLKSRASSVASTALSKISTLSKSLTSIFSTQSSSYGTGPTTPPLRLSAKLDDGEMVALCDLCPMPEMSYSARNRSPPSSEPNDLRCPLVGENITVYDCEIEQTYQQSTGTNSFESVVLMKDEEANKGKMVRHPIVGQARQVTLTTLVSTVRPTSRIEEWELRHMEKQPEGVPILSIPHNRLGDRENWLLEQITKKIQDKFTRVGRQDFSIDFKRGFKNGLPYLEVDVTPI